MSNADATKNPANPKERYGDKKRRVDLVPGALELGAAVALAEGAEKYGAFNWRVNHVKLMTYVGAIKRHLACFTDGENVDPESKNGKLHLEGIAASVAIMLDSWYAGIAIDDRPHKGPAMDLCRLPADAAGPQPIAAEVAAMAEAEVDEDTAAGVAAAREQLAAQLECDFDVSDVDGGAPAAYGPGPGFTKRLWRGEVENLFRCDDSECEFCPLTTPKMGA
jgi:hypothetical protein